MSENETPSADGHDSARPAPGNGAWNFENEPDDETARFAAMGAIVGRMFSKPDWIEEALKCGLAAGDHGLDEAAAHERWLHLSDRFAAHVATIPEEFAGMRPGPQLLDDMRITFGKAYRRVLPRDPQANKLATIWADSIALKLDEVGSVDGLLPRTGIAVAYGESGSGKTFAAVDLAAHVAAGLPWRGLEVEQGIVIYIAAESPKSVERRLWAWKQHHGVEHLPVLIVQSTVDMLNGDTAKLVELVRKVTAEHGRVAMVVVDTLARAMIGNENAPDDMGKFVAACGAIREAGDTMVLVVHHCGKNAAAGARGHSCLRAATDVELEVTNGTDGGCITVTKARDEADGQRFGFKLHAVELGRNAKGRAVTTCVAVSAEAPAGTTTKGPALTPKQRTVLDCYDRALLDHGQASPGLIGMPRGNVVAFATWREVALRFLPGDAPDWRKREEFKRAVEQLQGKGTIRHMEGWCWRPPSQTSQPASCDAMR